VADLLRQIDFGVIQTLNQLATSSLFSEAFVLVLARYGVLVYIAAGLIMVGAKKWKTVGVSALGIAVAGFLNSLIYLAWQRPRPFVAHAKDIKQIGLLVQPESFPSNHAFITFAVATAFWMTGQKKIAVYLFILAMIIAVARVAAGVHYPSDVVAGAILGIAVVPLAKQFYLLLTQKTAGV
jgi:undecaprenyl-diphosphatase